jgi:hypothetical protein
VVKPLDAFLRDHVRAPLKEKGFSRKGRDFRLVSENGDVALINFAPWRTGDREVEFILDAGILPLTKIEWEKDTLGVVDGSVASALWWTRLNSPFMGTGTWQFNLDDSERISAFLTALGALVDRLHFLIDRQNLISMVRDPATPVQDLRSSREHALAWLLVDQGPSRELEEIVQSLESNDPDDVLASWVRVRLSTTRSG